MPANETADPNDIDPLALLTAAAAMTEADKAECAADAAAANRAEEWAQRHNRVAQAERRAARDDAEFRARTRALG